LASNLLPVEVRPGISIATVTGALHAKDNKFKLQLLTKSQAQELTSGAPTQTLPPVNYSWGSLDLPSFMSLLSKAGIYDAVVEQNPNGCIVHIVCQCFD
jgi:integrator complex subunit 9